MTKYQKLKTSKADIEKFLNQMNTILRSPDFNIERDFQFQEIRMSDDADDMYNNSNTLLALDYSAEDIVEELKSLTVKNYSETIIDCKTSGIVPLYVFGKVIQGKEVYIKIRIKSKRDNKEFVFCLSFHFAKHAMSPFPYA